MKVIKFTDLEIESMIDMYTAEMEDAQMYIDQIKELLKKLGAEPSKEKVTEIEPKQKRGRKPAVKIVEKSEPKKSGRNKSVPAIEPVVVSKPVKEVEPPIEPKTKVVAKIKTEKKPAIKTTPKKESEIKTPAMVESVVTSLLTRKPTEVS